MISDAKAHVQGRIAVRKVSCSSVTHCPAAEIACTRSEGRGLGKRGAKERYISERTHIEDLLQVKRGLESY